MRPASPFTAVAAVEGWDAWFRWRDAAGLRDRTIEATWWRVARAAAAAEGAQADAWARRYFDAFAQWRLLPDENLLRAAGTGEAFAPEGCVRATLDVAAFVAPAGIDLERIADTAALAVRLLDDALLALRPDLRAAIGLRLGLLGLGDALQLLGLRYDGDDARRQAGDVAAALARGARRGAIELMREPGRGEDGHPATRFARLTAVVPQPRLARLANCASDALDPSPDQHDAGLLAQWQLRLAMQSWIDEPIDFPLLASRTPDEAELQALAGFAQAHLLAVPAVRDPAAGG